MEAPFHEMSRARRQKVSLDGGPGPHGEYLAEIDFLPIETDAPGKS